MRRIYGRLDVRLQGYANCLLRGMTNAEIAVEMGVSINTVRKRMRELHDQVGSDSRLQSANLLAEEIVKESRE